MSADHSEGLGVSGGIARFFQANALTPLIALMALLLGLFAVWITPQEEEPQINLTMANVLIAFPGAAVADVESLIATPAEQVLDQIEGVEHVFSVSRPGLAVITVQFKVGVPRIDALVRLHDTLAANSDWLPRNLGAQTPIVKPKGIDDVPIVALSLWSKDPQLGAADLERVAHSLEIELKRVDGTREVKTLGGPGRAIHIQLDPARMRAAGVSVDMLSGAITGRNTRQSAGNIFNAGQQFPVDAGDLLHDADQVKQIVVAVRNQRPVYLGDIATVSAGPSEANQYVWQGVAHGESAGEYPAVTLQITKKAGENAPAVAQGVLARVEQLKGSVIPDNIEVSLVRNYGQTAQDKASKLIQKLIFATLSVIALVWLALGRREAFIVGSAVALTLAATLFASWAWGFTLNRVSLFALIFSIGILVDDAIVVVENIHRHRQLTPNKPLSEIIPIAVDEVGGPTILATLTVIAALLPMAFVSGLMGPYMSPIPINASMGMLISLAAAFVITPWLALRFLPAQACHHTEDESRLQSMSKRLFTPFLAPQAGARKRRWLWLGIAGLIAFSVALAGFKLVVLKMLPFDNKSEFQVVVDMPAGTALENTAAVIRELGQEIAQHKEVIDYQAYVGAASPINFNGLVRQYDLRAAAESGDIQVNLVDKHQRDRQSHAIAQAMRPALEAIALRHGARLKVVEVPPGPPVLSPIVAEVYGPDAAGRAAVVERVSAAFAKAPDIVGIDSTHIASARRYAVHIDTRRAAQYGISQASITQSLQAALQGLDVSYLHTGHAKYAIPLRLSLPAAQKGNLDAALRLPLIAANGAAISLSELVQVVPELIEQPIYHKNLLPVSYVIADVGDRGQSTLDSPLYAMFGARQDVFKTSLADGSQLGEYFIQQPSDPYRQYAVKWDGEWQITYETFRDMGTAYAVGLVLIYLLVVAQFGNYLSPLIIMAPIPLTIIGVMPGHALLDAPFTATSMIGMIALAGIIVRNSILLVDFINQQVAAGMPFAQAVINSAATRAKPIVLTGLAAMLGSLFILDDPIFNGLAISLLFGIAVSTVLTLLVIPLLYFAANHHRHPRQET